MRAWVAALLFVLLPAPASAYLLCDDAAKLKEFNQAIRTWNGSLSDKRYAELDRHFSALHAAHESGKLTDAEVMRWYRLFESANAGNEPLHLEWIAAYPRSQAAYIALAVHMVERGFAARGRDFADKTSPLQFKGMADAFAKAIAALDKADTLSRKPTLSLAIRIRIAAAAGSKPDERQLYRTAITKYPDTLIARIRFIRVSHPKWGGSIEQLTGIATDAKALPEADRRYVEYLVFQEIGTVLVDQKDWRRAAEVYEKSVPLCPGFDDGLDNAIAAHRYTDDYPAMLRLIDQYIARNPYHARAHETRALARYKTGNLAQSYADYEKALNLGFAPALMSLAWFHFSGAAVKRDPERALDLLAQADARGVPGAKERAARVRRGEAPSAGP